MSKESRLIKQISPKPLGNNNFVLPNTSGDHVRSIKRAVPVDEADLVNKEYVDGLATKQVIELFLTTNASDIATYDNLDIDVSPDSETSITQTITAGGTTLINSFASKLNEGEIDALEILEKGIYNLHIHASATKATGMFIYFEFYHRTAGGTETLLGTSHDSEAIGLVKGGFDLHSSIIDDKIFIAGDRIVIKVYGRNTGGADKDISMFMEGDTVSRTVFPGFISPTFVGAHTIVSHSDTSGTGAELDSLTDNSMADDLHRHSELSASDGSPDKIVYVDSDGVLYADYAYGTGLNVMHSAEIGDHLIVGANITVGGTVDGVDIATDVGANTTHRGDNNQAHTDYLINNGNDTMAGILTATGFKTSYLINVATDAVTYLSGSTATNTGGNILLYGSTHGTPNKLVFRNNATIAMTIDAAQNVDIFGNVTIGDNNLIGNLATIADNGVHSFTLGKTRGIFMFGSRTAGHGSNGLLVYRAMASPFVQAIASNNVTLTTGILTGTTGADGAMTISVHTDGKIYVENRLGSTYFITYNVFGNG